MANKAHIPAPCSLHVTRGSAYMAPFQETVKQMGHGVELKQIAKVYLVSRHVNLPNEMMRKHVLSQP